ncbi:hypothetical protein F5X98DRAFT_324759 [Xylaria grammica]|nr:hypothetical protein F5X98DRAFT_324759 [Xylaria grammica]
MIYIHNKRIWVVGWQGQVGNVLLLLLPGRWATSHYSKGIFIFPTCFALWRQLLSLGNLSSSWTKHATHQVHT